MKAMILAAGLGTRMRPLTDTLPKPLLEVAGEPLIVWHLKALLRAGIKDIVINTSWLGQKLEQALGDGRAFGVNIEWSREPESAPLETAGGIIQALPILGHEPFMLVNGDVWLRKNLTPLRQALAPGRQGHLVLVDNPEQHPSGDFVLACGSDMSEGVRYDLGGDNESAGRRLTYAGVAVYCPSLFQGLTSGVRPLAPLLHEAIAMKRITGEYFAGPWVDVGTPQRLYDLNDSLRTQMSDS